MTQTSFEAWRSDQTALDSFARRPPHLTHEIVESELGIDGPQAAAVAEHFDSIADVLAASEDELAAVEGIGPATIGTIRRRLRAI